MHTAAGLIGALVHTCRLWTFLAFLSHGRRSVNLSASNSRCGAKRSPISARACFVRSSRHSVCAVPGSLKSEEGVENRFFQVLATHQEDSTIKQSPHKCPYQTRKTIAVAIIRSCNVYDDPMIFGRRLKKLFMPRGVLIQCHREERGHLRPVSMCSQDRVVHRPA